MVDSRPYCECVDGCSRAKLGWAALLTLDPFVCQPVPTPVKVLYGSWSLSSLWISSVSLFGGSADPMTHPLPANPPLVEAVIAGQHDIIEQLLQLDAAKRCRAHCFPAAWLDDALRNPHTYASIS